MALDYKSSLSRYRRYLQVMREQPLVRAGLWTALSLVLVIVMITMALKPTLVVIAGLVGQIKQDREIATKLDDKIVKLQRATGDLEQIRPRLAVLDQALPSSSQWDTWTQEIEQIASNSGVQLLAVDVGPVALSGNWPVKATTNTGVKEAVKLPAGIEGMNFTISASGAYDQLQKMVSDVEKNRRLTVLSGVQFASVKQKDGGTSLTVYISGLAAFAAPTIQ